MWTKSLGRLALKIHPACRVRLQAPTLQGCVAFQARNALENESSNETKSCFILSGPSKRFLFSLVTFIRQRKNRCCCCWETADASRERCDVTPEREERSWSLERSGQWPPSHENNNQEPKCLLLSSVVSWNKINSSPLHKVVCLILHVLYMKKVLILSLFHTTQLFTEPSEYVLGFFA